MNARVEPCSTPEVQSPPQLADCTSDEAAYQRYLASLNVLFEDASERRNLRMFADALTWYLAHVAVHCGTRATGDILAYLGKYMQEVAERIEAKRELERQREEGRRPN